MLAELHLTDTTIPFPKPVIDPEPDAPATLPSPGIDPDLPVVPLPDTDSPDLPDRPEREPELPEPEEPEPVPPIAKGAFMYQAIIPENPLTPDPDEEQDEDIIDDTDPLEPPIEEPDPVDPPVEEPPPSFDWQR